MQLYNAGNISFVAQSDSEHGWDILIFYIDGKEQELDPYPSSPTKYIFQVMAPICISKY